jgi:hypothetical protein
LFLKTINLFLPWYSCRLFEICFQHAGHPIIFCRTYWNSAAIFQLQTFWNFENEQADHLKDRQ